MIPQKPAPDAIGGGYWFADKIMLKQRAKAAPPAQTKAPAREEPRAQGSPRRHESAGLGPANRETERGRSLYWLPNGFCGTPAFWKMKSRDASSCVRSAGRWTSHSRPF